MSFSEVPLCRRQPLGPLSAVAFANPSTYRSDFVSLVTATQTGAGNAVALYDLAISDALDSEVLGLPRQTAAFSLRPRHTLAVSTPVNALAWLPQSYGGIVAATTQGLDFLAVSNARASGASGEDYPSEKTVGYDTEDPTSNYLVNTGSWKSANEVHAIDIEPKTALCAAACADGSISVHDLTSNTNTLEFQGHGLNNSGIAWRTAVEIVTASKSGQIKLYDTRNKTAVIDPIADRLGRFTCITVHPTQRNMLITGNEAGDLVFWDVKNFNKPLQRIGIHRQDVTSVKFDIHSPGTVYSSSEDGTICKVRYDFNNPELAIDHPKSYFGHSTHSLPINDIDIHQVHDVCIGAGDGGALLALEV